jgi:replicative DNA helicase loader DnaB
VIIREAKQANARVIFGRKYKAPRRAVVTESETKIIGRISQHELFR